jgi:hypothetical protein
VRPLKSRTQELQTLTAKKPQDVIAMIVPYAFLDCKYIYYTQRLRENSSTRKSTISTPTLRGFEQEQPGHCETKHMHTTKKNVKSARTAREDPDGSGGVTTTRFWPHYHLQLRAHTAILNQRSPQDIGTIKITRKQLQPSAGS